MLESKFKRNTERMSFFTTSRVWKALLLNKEKKKEQLAKLEKKDEKRQ